MKLKLKINSRTTSAELIHLGMLFTGLGLNSGAKVVSFSAPADPAELDEGETIIIPPTCDHEAQLRGGELGTVDAGIDILIGKPEPKRRRRTKAEIEAEIAEREAANKPATTDRDPHQTIVEEAAEKATATAEDAGVHAGSAIPSHEGEAGNVQPADTQPATATAGVEKEVAASEPATASPSDGKTYTAAEVQQQATVVARTHGADLVKAKIAELGGARIADLNAEQVNTLGAYLFSVK